MAGIELAREVFHHVDEQIEVEIVLPDGSDAQPGDTLLTVSGTVNLYPDRRAHGTEFSATALRRGHAHAPVCGGGQSTRDGAARYAQKPRPDGARSKRLPCAVEEEPIIAWGSMMRL